MGPGQELPFAVQFLTLAWIPSPVSSPRTFASYLATLRDSFCLLDEEGHLKMTKQEFYGLVHYDEGGQSKLKKWLQEQSKGSGQGPATATSVTRPFYTFREHTRGDLNQREDCEDRTLPCFCYSAEELASWKEEEEADAEKKAKEDYLKCGGTEAEWDGAKDEEDCEGQTTEDEDEDEDEDKDEDE